MKIALRSTWLITLGNALEYKEFFSCILNNGLIDRLYKRYIRYEDINPTKNLLLDFMANEQVNKHLCNILINAFIKCSEDSDYCLKKYGEYIPLRIVLPDIEYLMVEEEIPLEDYDNLEGDPLWMRPEYMLEKYGK